jgi:DNA-binding transcriptional ArsR family regulator
MPPNRVLVVDVPEVVESLAQPLRLRILDALREPGTAARVARQVGQSRQNVAYHVRELERLGLVRRVRERRNGNFVEQVFESVASTFVLSQRATWADDRRLEALQGQLSLEALVRLGERVQRDAAGLLDRAAFDGELVPSVSIDVEVRFADETARGAFMDECLRLLGPLLKKYGSRRGRTYRVAVAAYPDPEEA